MIENDLKFRIEKIFEDAIINARRQLDDLVAAVEGSEEPIKANPVKIDEEPVSRGTVRRATPDADGWRVLEPDEILQVGDKVKNIWACWEAVSDVFFGLASGCLMPRRVAPARSEVQNSAAVEGSEEPIKADPVKIEPGNCFEPGNGWIELGDDDVLETSDEIEVFPHAWVPIVPIFAGSPAGDVGTERRRYRRRVEQHVDRLLLKAHGLQEPPFHQRQGRLAVPPPLPDEGWRELGPEDVLRDGDEWCLFGQPWRLIPRREFGLPVWTLPMSHYRRRVDPTPTTKKAAVENLHDVPDPGEGRAEPTKEPNQTPQPQGRHLAEIGRLYADNFYGEEAIVKCMHAMADEIDRLVAEIVASKKGGGK